MVSKPAVRFGIQHIGPETLAALKRIEEFPRTRPLYFFVDEGNQQLWLVMSYDDESVLKGLLDAAAGGLLVKDHGRWEGWKDDGPQPPTSE